MIYLNGWQRNDRAVTLDTPRYHALAADVNTRMPASDSQPYTMVIPAPQRESSNRVFFYLSGSRIRVRDDISR